MAIVLFVFATGASVFCGLRSATKTDRGEAAVQAEALLTHTQSFARTLIERTELDEHVRELKQRLAATATNFAQRRADALVPRSGHILTPTQREVLLAEFGFNWNSTGDYLVVSKQTLRSISLDGVKGNKLAKVVCDVLAIRPEERATIEATMQQVAAGYKSWAESHVQREEPSGDVVAQYTMPAEAKISQSLSNNYVNGILTTLGKERGDLMEDYSRDWMVALGMNRAGSSSGDTTIIVKRYQAGDEMRLGFELRQAGGTMSTDVSPWQPFPEAFKPLFPGGWKDLAAREGFELPKDFQKKAKKP